MSTSLVSTGIQFPSSTIQTTSAFAESEFTSHQPATGTSYTWTPTVGFKRFRVSLVGISYSSGPNGSTLTVNSSQPAAPALTWYNVRQRTGSSITSTGNTTTYTSPKPSSYTLWDNVEFVMENVRPNYWDLHIVASYLGQLYTADATFAGSSTVYPVSFTLNASYTMTIYGKSFQIL
jgi:hypothetical protein